MNAALALFDAAIARGDAPADVVAAPLVLAFEGGSRREMPYAAWAGRAVDGDHEMLVRCTGPTIDLGCGPGRLVEALLTSGVPALGVDISDEALRQTWGRGALAVHRDLFSRLPGEHRWAHAILADGNIGIGGDPVGLLSRCRTLVADLGTVVVELAPSGVPSEVGLARLESGDRRSPSFPWAVLSADDLVDTADSAGLVVREAWTAHDRWFAELAPGTGP